MRSRPETWLDAACIMQMFALNDVRFNEFASTTPMYASKASQLFLYTFFHLFSLSVWGGDLDVVPCSASIQVNPFSKRTKRREGRSSRECVEFLLFESIPVVVSVRLADKQHGDRSYRVFAQLFRVPGKSRSFPIYCRLLPLSERQSGQGVKQLRLWKFISRCWIINCARDKAIKGSLQQGKNVCFGLLEKSGKGREKNHCQCDRYRIVSI